MYTPQSLTDDGGKSNKSNDESNYEWNVVGRVTGRSHRLKTEK